MTKSPKTFPSRDFIILSVIGLSLALLFILNCSGLHFPLFNPKSTLTESLLKTADEPLPPSATVERSARVAYRDPSRFFKVKMDPHEADKFFAALQAKHDPNNSQDNLFYLPIIGKAPDWWQPTQPPGAARVYINSSSAQESITAFHASGDPYVWIFWAAF